MNHQTKVSLFIVRRTNRHFKWIAGPLASISTKQLYYTFRTIICDYHRHHHCERVNASALVTISQAMYSVHHQCVSFDGNRAHHRWHLHSIAHTIWFQFSILSHFMISSCFFFFFLIWKVCEILRYTVVAWRFWRIIMAYVKCWYTLCIRHHWIN